MKKFTKEEIISLYAKVTLGPMTFSEMVEVINQRISESEDIPEEPKEGDLTIFWDENKEYAIVKIYDQSNGSDEYHQHKDQNGFGWRNAIKFESKEQYERLIKGEI